MPTLKFPKVAVYTKKDYEDIYGIDCHYGLTYSDTFLTIEDGKEYSGWFIGWDYAHMGDYYCSKCYGIDSGKRWTTQEIVDEAKSVIEQIIEIDSLNKV